MYPFFVFFNYTLCAIQHRQKHTAHNRWPGSALEWYFIFLCLFEGIHCPKAFKWSSDHKQHPCVSLTIKKTNKPHIDNQTWLSHTFTQRGQGFSEAVTNTDSLPKSEYKSAEVHIFPVKYFSVSNTASKHNLILKKKTQPKNPLLTDVKVLIIWMYN